jgi:hypothetical protein
MSYFLPVSEFSSRLAVGSPSDKQEEGMRDEVRKDEG